MSQQAVLAQFQAPLLRDHERFKGKVRILFGSITENVVGPQAFLVEQRPDWTLSTHFHRVHQYQVVMGGTGKLGLHELKPFSVHFSSPESAYGPIVSGSEGLKYLTLRAVSDQGAHYMPESRGDMRKGLKKRQVMFDVMPESSEAARQARASSTVEVLHPPEPTGIAAWLLRLRPGAHEFAPSTGSSGGAYLIAVGGTLVWSGKPVPADAVAFVPPGVQEVEVAAGADGLDLLVLQFPAEADGFNPDSVREETSGCQTVDSQETPDN